MTSVEQWLAGIGLERYDEVFRREAIDLDVLRELSDADLAAMGIPLGDRKRLLRAIAELAVPGSSHRPDRRLLPQSVPVAERRQLTVLFCDLVGSTDLAARFDPEDVRDGIRRFQKCCNHAVRRFDGHVALYLGDGVLAYFGYPSAHEDDPERAIRAALRIAQEIRGERVGSRSLEVRIGIATGLVVVGDVIGEGTARQEAVTGTTPNLAARLQSLAPPGGVLVAARTHQLAAGAFRYEDLGTVTLKGLAEPEHVWRVVADRPAASRFATGRSGALTPLVGRDQESARLAALWQSAKSGRGRLVWLSGEPGIGKSRLVQAVAEAVAGEQPALIQCQCSPFHIDSALHPILAWIEQAAGIAADERPTAKLDRLKDLCAGRCADPDLGSELVAAALLLPLAERSPALRMSPQRQRRETISVLATLLLPPPGGEPTLLVVEDAHWADPTTLDVLDNVVDSIAEVPVLVVVTARPEMAPRWGADGHMVHIALDRLSASDTAAMIEDLATSAPLSAETIAQIAAKTDGIPLFAEELTKTVLESRRTASALPAAEVLVDIPATLRDSLMARLDRLGSAKEVAQIGAAIGREFDDALIRSVAEVSDAELDGALAQLTAAGLLFRRDTSPQVSYVFKHALVQDVAYDSLLKSRRMPLHQRIGDAIERGLPEVSRTQPEVLARHYASSALPERAIPYWLRAGEQARGRSAHAEAKGHLNRGLELLHRLAQTQERTGYEIELLINLGAVEQAVTGLASKETEALYTRARELCEASDDRTRLFPVLFNLWLLTMHRGQVDAAKDLADRLSTTAGERADSDLIMQAEHAHWPSDFFRGDFAGALRAIADGCGRYDPRRHHMHKFVYGGHDPLPCGLIFKALCHVLRGEYAEADAACATSMAKARELKHPFTLVLCGAHAGIVRYFENDLELVTAHAEEVIELATREGFPLWLAFGMIEHGWARARRGDESGLALIEQGLVLKARTGSTLHAPFHLGLLAHAQQLSGRFDAAAASFAEALAVAADHNERWMLSELLRLQANCLHESGGSSTQCEALLKRAREEGRALGAQALELRAATSLARLWRSENRRQSARELLERSLAGCPPEEKASDVREARELLRELSR